MQTVFSQRYRFLDLEGDEITELNLEHENDGLPEPMFSGKVKLKFSYLTTGCYPYGPARESYTYWDTWSQRHLSDLYQMKITDFILPTPLRGRGVGTAAWSLIYRTLPLQLRGRLQLFGTLTRKDAADQENRLRRDTFWNHVLEIEGPETRYDPGDDGEGGFRGMFVDPRTKSKRPEAVVVIELQ